jgi:hypothetical protein
MMAAGYWRANVHCRLDRGADLEAPPAGLGTVRSLPIREVPIAVAIGEILELTRGFLFRDPVPLLLFTGELIAPTGELTLWIIGEPAPLFFHFPAELLPVAFETIPIHLDLLLLSMRHVKEAGLQSVRLPQRCCSASELAVSHPADNFCF